jgi:hypothetical protein
MECLIQYLDDIEDAIYAVVFLGERLRRGLRTLFVVVASVALQCLGIFLALTSPPLALAAVSLLTVGYLYRSTVSPVMVATRG